MPDDRRRNGQDDAPKLRAEPIVIPLPRTDRKPPAQIVRPVMPGWASDPQFRKLMVDPLLQLIASANFSAEQTVENTAQSLVLSKAFNDLAGEVHKVGLLVKRIEKRLDGPEIEQRARAESSSQIDEAAKKIDEVAEKLDDAVEELTSPGVKTDSDRVRAIAREESLHAVTSVELQRYRDAENENVKLKTGIKIAVGAGIALTIIATVVSHFTGRASGLAEGARSQVPAEAAPMLAPPAGAASSGQNR